MDGLERFRPGSGADAELHAQHLARYAFAAGFVAGKRVVDVACGTGYGSSLLRARGAASVTGIDLSGEAIGIANREFAGEGIVFRQGDVSLLGDCGAADVVVSFETIEHLDDPETLLVPAARLLGDDGTLIISTPVRHGGSLTDRPANPFHVREWNEEEFDGLLRRHFGRRRYCHQYVYRKRPWPLSRTINRILLETLFRRGSAGFASFPVVDAGPPVPRTLIERGYMIAVCSGKAS